MVDIGLCGTEEVYFQTVHRGVGGSIMVTASHNPMDYNGMKLVREGARPISSDTGLRDIEALVEDRTDGLSPEFATWRFNVRSSNTEPLLRLNVETRADVALLATRIAELRKLMGL